MDAQPIHLFSPHYRVEECVDEVRECLTEGWTGWGAKCIEMEQAWRDYSGFRYAHFLNSATAGLHLAMKIFKKADGWRDGDEVITTPLTFPSTNHAVLYENLKPVFADVDEFLCLDPKSVLERISPRTRAVAFVGLGGNAGRYQEVRRICGDHGLRLIVDAAHMAGTREGGRHAGLDADASVFSFHAVKNLPTADSGMVCFQDEKFDLEARRWSWLGIDKDTYARTREDGSYSWIYEVDRTGYKYQGNSIMAALGLVGVRYLEVDNETRRQIALWYDKYLLDAPGVSVVPMAPGIIPSRHLYQVQVGRRNEVMADMNGDNIFPGVHYRASTDYPMYTYGSGTCPRAELASERIISLPVHPRLTHEDVSRVADSLRRSVSG
jgi:dTDP-4-amino-4,6-dideoxygalactose transaminase